MAIHFSESTKIKYLHDNVFVRMKKRIYLQYIIIDVLQVVQPKNQRILQATVYTELIKGIVVISLSICQIVFCKQNLRNI